jgi:DNA-binding NtrC family response regulator
VAKVLVADDDRNLRRVLRLELAEAGHDTQECEDGGSALERIGREEFDVVLLDLHMPGGGGMEALRSLRAMESGPEAVVLTAHGTVAAAVEAMKLGAYDFLTKPFHFDELRAVIDKAVEKRRLRLENVVLRSRLDRGRAPARIVSVSPVMAELLATLAKVAASDHPVLLQGESGTGKELLAQALHDASPRAGGPLVAINCGAVPEPLLESELFGHERGAFTGAHARKLGLLEIAHRGTLFLDEIAELPAPLQVKFLRALENHAFFRVGGVQEIRTDVRVVAAANRDLKGLVAAGAFRADLYYRVSTVTLAIPPLRARVADVPPLVQHLVDREPGQRGRRFGPAALAALQSYAWPGNVRELQNVVSRTLLLSPAQVIGVEDLPADIRRPGGPGGHSRRLADVEREHVLRVLAETGGQRGRAAEILGIDPKTLYRKLREFGAESGE